MHESLSDPANAATALVRIDEPWVKAEVDDIVFSFCDRDLASLADELESQLERYDSGRAAGVAVASELRRRHRAGVRSWPIENALPAISAGRGLSDDDLPW